MLGPVANRLVCKSINFEYCALRQTTQHTMDLDYKAEFAKQENEILTLGNYGMTACNWCNGTEFSLPEDTPNKSQIVCTSCFSKPRQRCLKSVLDENRLTEWLDYNVLQMGPDLMPMIDDWFKAVEVSVFEGNNSIDLENANRADNTYDMITCVHVLEHIKDETKAITELVRMLTPNGQLYLMVPQPALVEITQDWGYPDEDNFGHYRLYGKDFTKKLQSIIQSVADLELFEKVDTVAGKKEFVYVITKG